MFPVKVYDKHGNLLRTISSEELDKKSTEELFAKKARGMNWRKSALVKKEMKKKAAIETNNELFARNPEWNKEHNIETKD